MTVKTAMKYDTIVLLSKKYQLNYFKIIPSCFRELKVTEMIVEKATPVMIVIYVNYHTFCPFEPDTERQDDYRAMLNIFNSSTLSRC